jgi:hypothetical protein
MTRASLTARLLLAGLLLPSLAFAAPDASPQPQTPPATQSAERPKPVDLVICLDSSGSMDGLLDSTRRKIWDVASMLAQAQPAPRLRVALLSFGSGRGGPDSGDVILESPFTDELDLVYEKLFALAPTGSDERVGRVLHESLTRLQWSTDPGALKMIFVAGNESADQDREYDFREQVKTALQHSVVVNAIYCGNQDAGDAAGWREVATLGGGEFAAVDQNGTITIKTPYDQKLSELGSAINRTYLAFGREGRARQANQLAQDSNAAGCGTDVVAARAQMKANSLYCNSSWDLIDASRKEGFDWSKIKDEDLPPELKGKTKAEKDAVIKGLAEKRTKLQREIAELGTKRTAFIKAELAKRAGEAKKTLSFAVAKAVKKAAQEKGFRFE